MAEVVIVGDKYLASGFKLIGVDSIEADDDISALEIIKQLVSQGSYKMVIITETIAVKLRPLREDMLRAKTQYPIFVIIPGFGGSHGERTKELYKLVDQAMGVRLERGG